jgi:WD40 repeat protein
VEEVKLRSNLPLVRCVAFSPDAKTLVSGSGGRGDHAGELCEWDVASGKLRTIWKSEHPVKSVAFSPDGQFFATVELDRTARFHDVATGKGRATPWPVGLGINRVAFSPDGKLLATANIDKTLRLWEVAAMNQEPIRTLEGADAVQAIAFSPDGQRLADGSKDSVRLWDVHSGKEVASLQGHKGPVESVAFSPDGKLLASAGGEGAVRLWEVATGKEVRRVRVSQAPVLCLAFAPDGRRVAVSTGSPDEKKDEAGKGEVIVWDAVTGKIKALLRTQAERIFYVTFSPDGRRLATANSDGTVIIWRREVRPPAGAGPGRVDGLVADRLDQLLSQLLHSNRTDDQVAEALYLATLGRLPTDGEKRNCARLLREKPDARQEAFERLLAALTASTECQAHLEALQKRSGTSRLYDKNTK